MPFILKKKKIKYSEKLLNDLKNIGALKLMDIVGGFF